MASSRTVTLHGHPVTFREAGSGPVVVLIHGIAGSSRTWDDVMRHLAGEMRAIAPDLLGHGESAKPRGDYSLGSFASGIRDLLVALDVESATLVGHSLGGGIALQFAYQFPRMAERVALISSGGLGREVDPLLRALSLPGAEWVLPIVCNQPLLRLGRFVRGVADGLGRRMTPATEELARSYDALAETEARAAFVHTLRGLVDVRGQLGDATDRLYLAELLPMLIVWGERDGIIPVAHAHEAHARAPGSRLEILEDMGHFPHRDDPEKVAGLILDFVHSTEPASNDARDFRDLILAHGGFVEQMSRSRPPRR